MFIGDEANPFKADREDFRDEIERLEAEQATFLAAFEDDGKVVAGPEAWFQNSPWNAASFRLPHAFARRAELSVDREKQGEPAGVPGMLMMADSAEDPEQAFRDAASQHGITLPDTLDSKKIQRFDPATGKLKKDGSGWCRFHNDNLPAGAFGDFATGVNEKWHAKLNGKLTEQERLEFHKRKETLAREAEYKKRYQQKEAAKVAATHWAEAAEATDTHAYLLDKGVHSYGLRLREGQLIMPLRDADNALHSYQSIDEKGTKRFLGGGLVEGLFFVIGVITPGILYIAEGYASAASVHEASGRPVIVALNCGNLLAVAKVLRAKDPEAELVFCADADSWTGKPGENKADEAARAVRGKVTVPVFAEMRTIDEKPTDFNDLHQLEGLEAVRRCLADAKAPAPSGEEPAPKPSSAQEGSSYADKLKAAVDRLALLSLDEYELKRDPESKVLEVRIGYLDKQVEKARRAIAATNRKIASQGRRRAPMSRSRGIRRTRSATSQRCNWRGRQRAKSSAGPMSMPRSVSRNA